MHAWRPATLLKRGLQHKCFHVKFANTFFYRAPLVAASVIHTEKNQRAKTTFIHYSLVLLSYTPWKHLKTFNNKNSDKNNNNIIKWCLYKIHTKMIPYVILKNLQTYYVWPFVNIMHMKVCNVVLVLLIATLCKFKIVFCH